MNKDQWDIFCKFKSDFKEQISTWMKECPELRRLQRSAVEMANAPLYPFETEIVYNKALDEIKQDDDIKLIIIGDNPGKDEQLIKNNKYLVGQAGKIAEGYFKKNSELGIDFRRNVIILNKTPIHSGKTAQLKTIEKLGGEKYSNLLKETQIYMAEKTAGLHCKLVSAATSKNEVPELWLVGYSELKKNGIFIEYRDRLRSIYRKFDNTEEVQENTYWDKVFVFQHFSMNRFSIDLNNFVKTQKSECDTLEDYIHQLGRKHKKEIFI